MGHEDISNYMSKMSTHDYIIIVKIHFVVETKCVSDVTVRSSVSASFLFLQLLHFFPHGSLLQGVEQMVHIGSRI
jgi:hypothetical protein